MLRSDAAAVAITNNVGRKLVPSEVRNAEIDMSGLGILRPEPTGRRVKGEGGQSSLVLRSNG